MVGPDEQDVDLPNRAVGDAWGSSPSLYSSGGIQPRACPTRP